MQQGQSWKPFVAQRFHYQPQLPDMGLCLSVSLWSGLPYYVPMLLFGYGDVYSEPLYVGSM